MNNKALKAENFTPAAQDSAASQMRAPITDDREIIRTAATLTRDLNAPNPAIYWGDFMASVIVGYGALFAAIAATSTGWMIAAGIVSMLALYRAGSFIHELTHLKDGSVLGFRLGWNLLAGIPLMVPSFMYEGVHNLHHAKTRYGTVQDPEYLPLALMKPYTVPLFVAVAALAPLALLLRYGILGPLSLVIPPLRKLVVERYSGLVINPEFRRKMPEGKARRNWMWQETGASLWAIALLGGTATGIIPLKAFIIFLVISGGSVVINQVRTLVAHLWANEGEVMSVTAQYLDSVNVPPPAMLPALWAPVGLRYHALHHLLPGVPYHNLGEAHRRLAEELPVESPYYKANYTSLTGLVVQLVRSTFKGKLVK
ncbi:fatty acid desaturase [Sphingorhabdus sp. Alg239-R122]|uniref:fatty acid desaturase family protein n=1 Tax=Sphingorhabdus sp. Alg239-R122 TaxID=2305989 RepID=UPI0013D9401F|nr:fatty acid desaturase [Sphingorhabdus sp. Alg239-R122]